VNPLRKLAVVGAVAFAVALGGAGEAWAADECRGLQVCLPVAGPWVALPAPSGDGVPSVTWQMRCPLRGYIVAGIDARVSDRSIDVSIRGENGAPVSPGVTTGREVLFTAVYTGGARRRTSFRPYIGCVPTSGGGGRGQTSVRHPAAFAPGKPLDRRVLQRRLVSGDSVRVAARCPAGARLLGAQHAYAFRIEDEPGGTLLSAVQVRRTIVGGLVTAVGTVAPSVPQALRVELQLHLLCTKVTR
jgi:hypothetical protein